MFALFLDVLPNLGSGFFGNIFGEFGIVAQLGVYTYFLPFLLVFAICYAALTPIPPFASARNARLIVAVVLALYVTSSTSFLLWYRGITTGISQLLALLVVILVFLLILYELARYFTSEHKPGHMPG